jgi:hypothetical protein
MAEQINLGLNGPDAIKGSVFFGSSLTPGGTFQNVPLTTRVDSAIIQQKTPSLTLTLQKLEEQLQAAAKKNQGVSDDPLSEQSINTFLNSYVKLLIDYRDLRNFVFFGSAYNELSFHINYLVQNYPFKSFVAKDINLGNAVYLKYAANKTVLSFKDEDVLQKANYSFDDSGKTQWLKYEVLDQNNTRFPIIGFQNWDFIINNITNSGGLIRVEGTILVNELQSHSLVSSPLTNGEKVRISGVLGTVEANNTPTNPEWTITNVSYPAPGKVAFDLVGSSFINPFIPSTDALIETNIKCLIVTGFFSVNNFVEYKPTPTVFFKGFVISPTIKTLNDFYYNLLPPQKELLNKSNPIPWPRYDVTDNIHINTPEFQEWLEQPSNSVLNYNIDEFGIIDNPIPGEYNLKGALALDETVTNQLLRRAIPEQIINEFNDADGAIFTRFILLAGKLFDTIKVYIDFLKYTKTLNYSFYNQLSPEFYKEFANHYGFDLYDDDSINFADAVIKTEPGLRYDSSKNPVFDDQTTSRTLKELQQEKQKRLLINLLYLYSKKGTQVAIQTLTSLLGAPKGLVEIAEYMFDKKKGEYIVNNEKVYVPKIEYEIDPEYLQDPVDIDNPVNKPYVYRLKLQNDHLINLREMSINTNPQQALLEQMLSFGKIKYPLVKFHPNTYASLISDNPNGYFMLPLTFPDKFTGITVEYMLPKNGLPKGIGNGNSESSIHIGSLYKVPVMLTFSGDDLNKIAPGTKFGRELPEVFENMSSNYGAQEASCVFRIINLPTTIWGYSMKVIIDGTTIATTPWALTKKRSALNIVNAINFSNTIYRAFYKELENDVYEIKITTTNNNGYLLNGKLVEVNLVNTSLLSAPGVPDYTNIEWPDGQLLKDGWPKIANPMDGIIDEFIIARQEGNDVVIRLRLKEEAPFFPPPMTIQRVAIIENVFKEDGLLHQLRLIYRPEGVEAFQDFKFIGLFRWRDPSTAKNDLSLSTPYTSLEIPKHRIYTCDVIGLYTPDGPDADKIPDRFFKFGSKNTGFDLAGWWDLFIGLPVKSNMYFKRIAVHELPSVDNPDSLDFGKDPTGLETEKYSFDLINQEKVDGEYIKHKIKVPANFKTALPVLPGFNTQISDYFINTYSELITDMTLTSSYFAIESSPEFVESIQDFYQIPSKNSDDLFTYNSWSKTIHRDYEYDNYNAGLLNYETYSSEVVTYISLLSFMELVEDKFKPLIKQFIPIVINLTSFGRIIKSFSKKKVRYPKIEYQCEGTINPSSAVGKFRIIQGKNNNSSSTYNITIKFVANKIITNASNTSPIQITTLAKHNFNTGDSVFISGVNGNTAANGLWTITRIDDYTFSLNSSVGNGVYNNNSNAIAAREDIVLGPYNWLGSNSNTSNIIINAINTSSFYPGITAALSSSFVKIIVDPGWYLSHYGQDINDIKLVVKTGDPAVVVSDVTGFTGGVLKHIGNSCITLSYSVPIPEIITLDYIYFESENATPQSIYYENESEPPYFIL